MSMRMNSALMLRTGAWTGVRPGADRGDRVWRYGDITLHFDADTLCGFFGQVIPDCLLETLASGDRLGVWTERLESGAQLDIERPHFATYPRLSGFSVTR